MPYIYTHIERAGGREHARERVSRLPQCQEGTHNIYVNIEEEVRECTVLVKMLWECLWRRERPLA